MEWSDDGIVLSARAHGETSVVAALFTRSKGRCLGLVRGGKSRRMRPVLQPGNIVRGTWRARLDEHLGSFSIEPVEAVSAAYFDDPMALAAMGLICGHLTHFAERDPHPYLYDGARFLLSQLGEEAVWPGVLARFEMEVLSELGFQLDLSSCAASGVGHDLIYVSPKSGRAVSREAGAPYRSKLLALPAFLAGGAQTESGQTGSGQTGSGLAGSDRDVAPVTDNDLRNGFMLTGYFFEKHIYAPLGDEAGAARRRFMRYFEKSLAG